jgi:ornithine cyclodeaminase/alanine dehydrogenase
MELAYDSVESVMKMQSDGSVYLKPRTTKSFGDSKLLADMTASIPEMNVFGIKHYVVNDGKYFYYIYLYDFQDKNLLAILEAEEIGRYRTAAVTSLAINKLRTKEMNNLAIIGTGFQAHQQLKSVITSNADFNKIYIFSPNQSRRTKFVRDFQKLFAKQEFVNCESMEDALINSDVIITATNSAKPVINYNYLKDQYLIIGMGAATPYYIEIDDETISNCNLIIADDIDQAKLESGDLLNPASKGLLQWKDVIYFSDIFKSHFKLSENKNKIFFKSLGIATWDVSIANDIYKKYINSL